MAGGTAPLPRARAMGRASWTAPGRFCVSDAAAFAGAMAICPAAAVCALSHLRLTYPFPCTGEGCALMDDTRRLTYGELAAARGVTVATARRMATSVQVAETGRE